MKDIHVQWHTYLLCLVLALSHAIVLEHMELVDFQKLQRLCMDLCVMDLNGYSMIWDPQWFESLGHVLPLHRYAFCALPSFLLFILMPFTSPFSPDHIFAPLGDPLGPCLRKEEPEELEAGSNCRSGERRSRAQGLKVQVLRYDLWWRREPAQVHWNIVQRRLGSQRFNTANTGSVVASMSAVFVSCWTFGYECRNIMRFILIVQMFFALFFFNSFIWSLIYPFDPCYDIELRKCHQLTNFVEPRRCA